ncbi:MAG: putative membrane protein insertion efficiency factor [Sphingobacteriales bacterium]|jgi:putative membrane protein insertion efficiency factor
MKKALAFLFILPIKFYKYLISPLLPSTCRHVPTCSTYTIEAIKEWGALKGLYLGIKRLLHCHPWGTSGFDPVPKKS